MKKLLLIVVGIIVTLPLIVSAMEYKSGDNITLSLTNATDGAIQTGNNCNISISNSSGTQISFSEMKDAGDGTYFWEITGLSSDLEEKFLAKGNCTIGTVEWTTWMYFWLVDDPIANKTNYISHGQADYKADISGLPTECGSGSSNLTEAVMFNGTLSSHDASDVWIETTRTLTQNITPNVTDLSASDVWDHATRTLTQNITPNVTDLTASDIWSYATRELTSLTFNLTLNQTAIDNIASGVWGYTTRELTGFGTLIADIWASATRTLTGFAWMDEIWEGVWNGTSSERNLTSGSYDEMNFLNTTQQEMLESINSTVIGGVITNYYNSTMNIIIPE